MPASALVSSALASVTAIRAEAAFPAVAAFAPETTGSTIALGSIALGSVALGSVALRSITLGSVALGSITLGSIHAGLSAFWCSRPGCRGVLII